MASKTSTILTRIQTRLRSINGAGGGYVYTLSDDVSRVLMGDCIFSLAEQPPRIYLTDWAMTSDHDHSIGSFNRVLTVTLIGVVAATTDEPGARMLAATDLLDDIAQCIEADRGLKASDPADYVNDCFIRTSEIVSGDEMQQTNLGGIVVTLEINWWAASGEGA